MFDFKKGNSDNLEGRVIIYLNTDTDSFHAFRAEIKFEKSEGPKVFAPIILKGSAIIEPTMYDLEVHLSNYQMLDEKQPLEDNCDVIYLGKVHAENPQSIALALHSGINIYACFYADQQLFKKLIKENKDFAPESESVPDYRTQSPEKVRNFLYSQLGLLKDAISSREDLKEKAVSRVLTDYMKSSPFTQDIDEIIGLARFSDSSSLRLIELYVEKIVNLIQDNPEGYMRAGEIKIQIRQILDSTT